MTWTPQLFQCLENRVFARLYFAQTVNLIGDALNMGRFSTIGI